MKKKSKKKRSFIKRDYQRKKLDNPFFKKKEEDKKRRWWRLWLFLLLILGFAVVYLLSAPWFNISSLKVNGLGRLPESAILESVNKQMAEPVGRFFKKKNIFLFNTNEGAEELLKEFNFSQIKITKKYFPNELIINIYERPYAFIWIEEGKTYYSDSSGYIINDQEVDPKDFTLLPVIENQSQKKMIKSGNLVLSEEYLKYIFNFNEAALKYPDLTISKFIVPQEDVKNKSLRVLFADGLLAYFSINSNIEEKLLALEVVKKEKIKDNLSDISYLDSRYGDKIFIGNK